MSKYILALDQGTSSSRAIIFDREGNALASAQREFAQTYPQPGWVEQDAMDIYNTQVEVAKLALAQANLGVRDIAALGVTNQRETLVVWEKDTGLPIHNAIVWQCRRTAQQCAQLSEDGADELIAKKTGLKPDAYFSATKLKWILDNVPGAAQRARAGELLAGTVDSFLIYKLTGGRVHATDVSNASRTMLFNIHTLQWDDELLALFDIPRCMLGDVRPSSYLFGETQGVFDLPIPIASAIGDQQAALFGQACFERFDAKNTYGTGNFLLMNTGGEAFSKPGLLTTIAWDAGQGVEYALEGSVFIAGAAIQWLRDELGFIKTAAESEALALSVEDTGGVYFVPAFVGLGAPHWDSFARGGIHGLTRGSGRAHIVRAALEAIAYQSHDLLLAMQSGVGQLKSLKVDGGASANDFLMQFQADILGVSILRPRCIETTALGAAYLAGLAVGYWKDKQDILANWQLGHEFTPAMAAKKRAALLSGWNRALERCKGWVN